MNDKRNPKVIPDVVTVLLIAALMFAVIGIVSAAGDTKAGAGIATTKINAKLEKASIEHNVPAMRNITSADRLAAARDAARMGLRVKREMATATLNPGGVPDYFGAVPNYANSPLPNVTATGISGGLMKFVDALPGVYVSGVTNIASVQNGIGQYIPAAVPDTTTYPGSDYYEIGLVQYTEQLHSNLSPTTLRGYVQLNTVDPLVSKPSYLGPVIIAQKNRPVRVKFINMLPTGAGGNLFLPTDTTVMGAGLGPDGVSSYSQNRATLHLHGGNTPWISDGTMHQWTTPAGETTAYPKGVDVYNVPDMDGGTEPNGTLTFYYTNQQGARLLWYHDHAYGITRLNVYAGEVAPYVLHDTAETSVVGTIPEIPLVIQDKAFLPGAAQLAAQDPTWPFALNASASDLWFPHVYMPNQNPGSIMGANNVGRWDYGPWFWPPFTGLVNGPVANPYYDPVNAPWEPAVIPGTPNPSIVPEAFVDTPLVNGNAYPYLEVGQQAYRFRILNGANDRYFNLQLYYATTQGPFVTITGGNGTGASAIATVNASGMITGIAVTSGGAGYDNLTPVVSIYDAPAHAPAGTGAAATAIVDINPANVTFGQVFSINVTSPGSGYSVPTVANSNLVPASLATEVAMVPAIPGSWPSGWPTPDGRAGGWPDPTTVGPSMIEIGSEGGLLPAPAVIQNRPVGYDYNRRSITVLNVLEKALFLGPAERGDVIVDFSAVPAGSTLIMYNDAPAPVPAFDPRNDYYTNAPDQTLTGGAPSTIPGYGPNTRTVMQIRVNASLNSLPAVNYNLANLPAAYNQSQDLPIVPQAAYNTPFNANYPVDAYARIQDTSMTFLPAAATQPVRSVNVTNPGGNYTAAPLVNFTGGGGTNAAATAILSTAGSVRNINLQSGGSGYTSAPTVTISGGGGSGAAAIARINTTTHRVIAVTLTSLGSSYTSIPNVTFSGGGGTGARARATLGYNVSRVTVTNGGTGYTSAPAVRFLGGNGSGAAGTASILLKMDMEPKSIIEDFDVNYGRMNAMLGVEVPRTTAVLQTSIPYYDIDPPTEIFRDTVASAPLGTFADGTQIWKITHNGVDTHAIHWHMFNVQLINRVGWDGMIKVPDANEEGWKDTIRMNPLEDIIIAARPIKPVIPFEVPNSIRALDVTMPLGTSMPLQFHNIDPTNEPAPVVNHLVNFGWEYMWHCHLLGHEENIMMRMMAVATAPNAPINLQRRVFPTGVYLNWTDNSTSETAWAIQRATVVNGVRGPFTTIRVKQVPLSPTGTGLGATRGNFVAYTDTTAAKNTLYNYRILATNVVGDTRVYAAPATGYPHLGVNSGPSNVVAAQT